MTKGVALTEETESHGLRENWGGALSNPGIQFAHAIASIVSPTLNPP